MPPKAVEAELERSARRRRRRRSETSGVTPRVKKCRRTAFVIICLESKKMKFMQFFLAVFLRASGLQVDAWPLQISKINSRKTSGFASVIELGRPSITWKNDVFLSENSDDQFLLV